MPKQKKSESRVPRNAKTLLKQIADCRHNDCLVASHHPFYWSREPVSPVVPTYLQTGKIMIIAAYPTARFVNFPGTKPNNVPYYDVAEPLADTRYYDGTGVRDVKAGTFFNDAYLEPLGLKREDLWITNTVKCFLFTESQAKRHEELAMLKEIRILPTRDDFYDCARPCVKTHLIEEVKICKPKLIITLGAEAAEAVHGTFGGTKRKPKNLYGRFSFRAVLGKPLLANKRLDKKDKKGHFRDKREGEFLKTNMFHLIHPGFLMRIPDGSYSKNHWRKDLPALFDFIKSLGLKQDRDTVGIIDRYKKKQLEDIAKDSMHEIDHGDDNVTK